MKNFILTFLSTGTVLYMIFTAIANSPWIPNWPESIADFYIKLMIVIFIIMFFGFNSKINNKNNNPYLT